MTAKERINEISDVPFDSCLFSIMVTYDLIPWQAKPSLTVGSFTSAEIAPHNYLR